MIDFFLDVIVPLFITIVLGIAAVFVADEVQHVRKGMRDE